MSIDSNMDDGSSAATTTTTTTTAPAARRGLSKLPVPRKVSTLPVLAPRTPVLASPVAMPRKQLPAESERPALRFSVPDPTPQGRPSLAKSPSINRLSPAAREPEQSRGGYLAGTSASSARTGSKGSSIYGVNAATGTPLRKTPSVLSLQQPTPPVSPRLSKKPSIPTLQQPSSPLTPRLAKVGSYSAIRQASPAALARKPSIPQLEQPRTTPKRKTSEINGAAAPPLNRKASNSSLPQSTSSSSARKVSVTSLYSTDSSSPTPLRRVPSSELRAPKTPTIAKTPKKVSSPETPRTASRMPKMQATSPVGATSPDKTKASHKLASQSLRETIAKAKAARRAVPQEQPVPSPPLTPGTAMGTFDFGGSDPFNKEVLGVGGSSKVLQQRIKSARFEGRLNIAALDLKNIPPEVYKMYESTEDDLSSPVDNDGPKWYESVDLVRFVAADNEIEEVGDELATEFGGLTQIDMHNNLLTTLPKNFGNLTELTVLNLSKNKLDNGVMDLICQITSLKDLKLARNGLEGMLSQSISKLTNLETLELSENRLKSLPGSLAQLSHLHSLNVSNNCLSFIPFGALYRSPIAELDVSNNNISGSLFPEIVTGMDSLRVLDIRKNSICALSEAPSLALPNLVQLLASHNDLSELPSVADWQELCVLALDANHLSALPDGLLELPKLRSLDLTGNDLKTLEPRLGAMDSLDVLRFDGNPLRDRNLLGMSTVDVKKTLCGRLAPTIVIAEVDDDDAVVDLALHSPDDEFSLGVGNNVRRCIEVNRSGVLDLSGKGQNSIDAEFLSTIIGSPSSLILAKNSLAIIPSAISAFASTLTTLDLSQNQLNGDDYLVAPLPLRALTNLSLVNTALTTLTPLITHLDAPKLDVLDVAANRITSIDGVKAHFAALSTLLAADNQVAEIPVEGVRGLRTLDLTGNALDRLPPELGTLEGLKDIRVIGNRFRVPRFQVLEKGSEAVLEWCRERLPQAGEDQDPDADID